jgi:glycosyltransferase involved in cell wall biosynthesis
MGRKIVYCYAPARWLYQTERYLGKNDRLRSAILQTLAPYLRRWDRQAALSAHRYVTQSSAVRDGIRQLYGIDAEVLPGPYRLGPEHVRVAVDGIVPGFFLCVSRLLPYKNVDVVIAAFSGLPHYQLVVVGSGPEATNLKRMAPVNVRFAEAVSDAQLAWLYANCTGIVSASYEDYGLTPIEAASFGKPAVVLRWGGFVDTVMEERTGIFFESPTPAEVREAIRRLGDVTFSPDAIRVHASRYSEDAFIRRLRAIVASEVHGERVPLAEPERAVLARVS